MAKSRWNVEVKVTTLTMQFILFKLIMVSYATQTSGQTCVNNPNVNQRGQEIINSGRQVIVPRAKFNCCGRITNVAVSMQRRAIVSGNLPLFQVWHPTSLNSSTYNKIGEVQLPAGDFVPVGFGRNYNQANLPLYGNSRIEFQSGDVIGYYQSSLSLRLIWSIQTSGYTSYSNNVTSPSTSIDISIVENADNNHQPLIAVMFDIRCNNLSIPINGNGSCSSGIVGVGYEGDTCSFTCNTGYELSDSDTRTCQSDGSWSGTDNDCRRIPCPPLNNPNGMINCSLGDDKFTSYEDICSVTCNTGYELTGSDTRICQSDGSWSSNDSLLCKRVSCSLISDPNNGTINCLLGDDGVPSYEDTCSITCNTGYKLTGSDIRTCQSDGNWNGTDSACGRVFCSLLSDPINGANNCSLGDDGIPSYEDTCSFTCNTGYELTGNNTRTCQSDGRWSNSDVMCTGIPTSSSTGSSTDIIGASMGGVVLVLVITTMLLCIVMLCVKRFYKEKASSERLSYNTSKLQKGIPIEQNPSYDVIEMANGGIKRGDTDILITTNPSYAAAAAKSYSCKASDDECNYVQTNINEPDEYLDLEDTIKMDTNPSYGVTTGDRKTAFNSSDSMTHQPSHNTTTNEYDYANVHDNYLLHHSTAVNTGTSGGVKEESHYY